MRVVRGNLKQNLDLIYADSQQIKICRIDEADLTLLADRYEASLARIIKLEALLASIKDRECTDMVTRMNIGTTLDEGLAK